MKEKIILQKRKKPIKPGTYSGQIKNISKIR